MTFAELVKTRHSIRSYLGKPVEREKILACLEAARLAPSASNTQPWHFVVADDPALRQKLCGEAFSGIFSTMRFPREAPVLVAAVAKPPTPGMRAGNAFLRTNFGFVDMGIAIEHFVLQAAELGLGTCWMGMFDEGKVKKTLGIPRGHKVVAMLTLGYFDRSSAQKPHHRQALEQMSSFNGWHDATGRVA
jgi:nitroreductase